MSSGIYQHKKGWKHTKKAKRKMKKNNPHYWEGKHRSEKTRKKISKNRKGQHTSSATEFKKGHKINWKGGISFEPYSTDWNESLRRTIRERDHYTCQLCGKPQGDRVHSVHHIDYNKKNCDPDNLITLCGGCNTRVNFNRDYWLNYFKSDD